MKRKTQKRIACALCAGVVGLSEPAVEWYGRKLKAATVHEACFEKYRVERDATWARFDAADALYRAEHGGAQPDLGREGRERYREAMKYCVCGHKAEAHTKDELDNLTTCKEWTNGLHCDCDHFRYTVDAMIEYTDAIRKEAA
jgi:hypothetical protein